jgi:hypothetical protein
VKSNSISGSEEVRGADQLVTRSRMDLVKV